MRNITPYCAGLLCRHKHITLVLFWPAHEQVALFVLNKRLDKLDDVQQFDASSHSTWRTMLAHGRVFPRYINI